MNNNLLSEGEFNKIIETEFFQFREETVLDKLQQQRQLICERDKLGEILGIEDVTVLFLLQEAGFSRETVKLIYLLPRILTAWEEGFVDEQQRATINSAAKFFDVEEGDESFKILEQWFEERPTQKTSRAALRAIQTKVESLIN